LFAAHRAKSRTPPTLRPRDETSMPHLNKPEIKPARPFFSSGPCAKRPGWQPAALAGALIGRSHRSSDGRARLKLAIELTREILRLPPGYEVAIVPGSDTGAFELAMWNLLGERGVDVLAWDVFGRNWLRDAIEELKLPDIRRFEAEPGLLPDVGKADFSRDVIFTWNGTTTGVKVPGGDWIPDDRSGLTFCDATSALFAEDIDLTKLDVLTYSWQKALGGEAAHGMLILSPRALKRLGAYRAAWPVPKLFRLTNKNGIMHDVFEGVTINTPSMLCVEDYLDALAWVKDLGGIEATIARARANAAVLYDWISRTPWVAPLAVDPLTRSQTSVAMRFVEPELIAGGEAAALSLMHELVRLLESEDAAYDVGAYRGMPAGLRIWCGTTIETADILALLPWLEWAYAKARRTSRLEV
jgi:phosphoserine aminotransferase